MHDFGTIEVYHSDPEYKDSLYISTEFKISSYFGMEVYLTFSEAFYDSHND